MSSRNFRLKPERSFGVYTKKILKDGRNTADLSISREALVIIDYFLDSVLKKISITALQLARNAQRVGVNETDVQVAFHIIFSSTGDSFNRTEVAGTEALALLKRYKDARNRPGSPREKSRAKRVGLILAPSRVEYYLRFYSPKVAEKAIIYLAAITQDIIETLLYSNVLRLSDFGFSKTKNRRRKKIIKGRHISEAIAKFEYMDTFAGKESQLFLPFSPITLSIDEDLHSMSRSLRSKIRKLRSENGDVLPHLTFERTVRSLFANEELRFSQDTIKAVQAYAESEIDKFIRGAYEISQLKKMVTLQPEALDLLWKIGDYPKELSGDFDDTLPSRPIYRLCSKAGVKRVSKDSIPILKRKIFTFAVHILEPAVEITKHHKNKTITYKNLHTGSAFL